MPALREWLQRLLGTFRPRRRDDDLQEELRLHAELAAASGRDAQLHAGAQAMDTLRDQRRLPWLEDLRADVRLALRSMGRRPGFTAVALLTLALGIGANSAVFTVADAVLLKPLPIREPETLVLLGEGEGSGTRVGQMSGTFQIYARELYEHLRAARVLDDLAAVQSSTPDIAVRRDGWPAPQTTRGKLVSGNYFEVLGVDAHAGRLITARDDDRSAAPVAIVSFDFWQRNLNADRSVIGETLTINAVPMTVAGVAPPGFFGETVAANPPQVWMPLSAMAALSPAGHLLDQPQTGWLYLLGRRPPGLPARQAEARLTAALQNWLRVRRGAAPGTDLQARIGRSRVVLTPAAGGVPHLRRDYMRTLEVLLGITGAVLLLACANVSGLLLARGVTRRPEHATRVALGATRGRLIRQSLTESLTLALVAGVLALIVGTAAARLLVALTFNGADETSIPTSPDIRVVAFTVLLSCVTGAVFGILPALRTGRDLVASIKGRFRIGKVVVVAQVAVSLALLAVAGSLTQSLLTLGRQAFGFEPRGVLVATVDLRLAQYQYGQLETLYRQLNERLNALPGVNAAGFAYYSPFNGCCWGYSITIPGSIPEPDGESPLLNRVSSRYFDAIGTRLLSGRTFDRRDTATSPPVAVVNRSFAQRYFAGADPIGRTFAIDTEPGFYREIVGVVEDAKYVAPGDAAWPMAFLPFLQVADGPLLPGTSYSNFMETIALRTTGDPALLAGALRQTLVEIAPDLPVLRIETLSEHISRGLGQERAAATLASVFGLVSLALTALGLNGLIGHLVQQRTREIGVRMALGAARRGVVAMVMRETLVQAVAGLVAGVPLALLAVRLSGAGPAPVPGPTLAMAIGPLVLALVLAGYLPARRAARLDPSRVLRAE